MTRVSVISAVLLAALFSVQGDSRPTSPQIRLRSGSIDVLSQARRQMEKPLKRRSLRQVQASKDDRWGPLAAGEQLLISCNTSANFRVLDDVRQKLEAHGGWLGGYIPDNAVLGIGNAAAAAACRRLDGVLWVGSYLAEHKIAPELADTVGQRVSSGEVMELAVSFPLLHASPSRDLARSYDPAAAAQAEWPAQLEQAGLNVDVIRKNGHLVTASVQGLQLQEGLAWLSQHPAVHWISPWSPARLHNWQGTAVTQSATAAPVAPVQLQQDQGTHPLWAAGLTGGGQIIGGGDSGMDYQHCFFADPAVNWTAGLETDAKSGAVSFNSTSHRKIRLYRALGNGIEAGGHGTHTMGSLLGSTLNLSDTFSLNYRGIAPDAKVAFNDLGSSSTDGIFTPEDLSTSYFTYAYDVGARVHSDSWGSSSTTYDYMAAQVDLFTWLNQDFVSVFAAGNEGAASANNSQGATTVTSPATAKNCITAGATEVAGQSFQSNPQYVTADMTLHQPLSGSGADTVVETYLVMQASFGGSVSTLFDQQLSLSVADPSDACDSLQNSAAIRGSVVLIERGTCYMSTKVANAQAAGAAAALVYDNEINDYFLMLADGSTTAITIPGMSVPRRIGQLLVSSTQSGGQLRVSFSTATTAPQPWANLAPFSSKGPTPDGRVKPDLLAPGTLLSAFTNVYTGNTCALQTMQGTSMATPLIAGSAALVRQYFLSGAYPTGGPNAENAFQPSGALVKAVLIGGAAGLSGYEPDTGLPLAPPPSFRQGYGRVQLSQSLPIQGSGPGWSMQIIDMANLTTGDSHRYCLNGTGGPLTVTLVWHDYPAALAAAQSLVNDLDLTVRTAGLNGVPLLGNGGDKGMTGPDRTNNVEQVSLSYLPPGEIAIEVAAFKVFSAQGPQPYALAVLGKFSGVLASPSNPVNGGNSTAGDCRIVMAKITDGPMGLTNQTNISFGFGLESEQSLSGIAFECALMDLESAANSSATYLPCNSPAVYSNLTDGGYSFSVRAQGEQLADTRTFFKDTIPPQLKFLGVLPPDQTTAAVANFTFNATDMSAVNFSCMVSVQKPVGQGNVSLLQTNGPSLVSLAKLGQWQPCYSPIVIYWLLPGSWSLGVRAVDGAGNAAVSSLVQNWTLAFPSDTTYVRFSAAPLGAIGTAHPQLSFQALEAGSGPLSGSSFQCQQITGASARSAALNLTSGAEAAFSGKHGSWENCSSGADLGGLGDGDWAVAVRAGNPGSAEQLAFTAFTVDSQPPEIQISGGPGDYSNSSVVSFQIVTNDTGTVFECLLTAQGNASELNSSDFQPCSSPIQYNSLSDGIYTFSVTGTNRVGLTAATEEAEFLVDTRPPVFSDIRYPLGLRGGNVTVLFTASDGPDGSGLADVECRLWPIKLVSPADTQNASTSTWQRCSSPHVFSSPPSGHWALSLQATDRASMQTTTPQMDIWIEDSMPATEISAGPAQDRLVPALAVFNFSSRSASGIGTPIESSACRLVLISPETAGAAAAAPSPDASELLPGAAIQPLTGDLTQIQAGSISNTAVAGAPLWSPVGGSTVLPVSALGNISAPALDQAPASQILAPSGAQASTPTSATALEAFAAQANLGWHNCSSPVVYKGLNSGNYSFQVWAVDVAGNQGQPTSNYLFAVDQSLSLDGTVPKASFWGLGWKFWLIVAAGGFAVIALPILIATLCSCCSPRRRAGSDGAFPLREQINPPATARSTPRTDGHGFDVDATAEALRQSIAVLRNTPPVSPNRHSQRCLAGSPHESSVLASLEEAQLRQALQKSIADSGVLQPLGSAPSSGGTTPGALTSRSTSEAEDRALLSGRRAPDLHRALLHSMQSSGSRSTAQGRERAKGSAARKSCG